MFFQSWVHVHRVSFYVVNYRAVGNIIILAGSPVPTEEEEDQDDDPERIPVGYSICPAGCSIGPAGCNFGPGGCSIGPRNPYGTSQLPLIQLILPYKISRGCPRS